MEKKYNISLLPGDGIGQEISLEAKKIIDFFSQKKKIKY